MKWLLIVIVVSLIAIRYLFVPGFLPTHDGEYHLIRFYEFAKMLSTGVPFPRWAQGLNSTYGVPLFIFFYPLPNYIGSLFHFAGLSLADSFRLTMATGYLIAVVASYFWLRRLFGTYPAVVASLVGAFTPYWFVDIFVRGSVGEVLALGFVFVSLASIVSGKKTILAFAIAAMILSHNILAMIFLPILLTYAWMTDRSLIRGVVMGILLSAYFWIPALVERGNVVGLNTVNFRDHFPLLAQLLIPSWGTGLSGSGYALDEMSYQIGIVPILIFLASLGRKRRMFVWITGVSFFLMLAASMPVWEVLPLLRFVQYPWRFLSVVVVATPFLAASLISHGSKFAGAALVVLAVLFAFPYTKPVLYAPRPDDYYLSRREFTDGSSSLGNGFSTRWMPWRPERPKSRMEIILGNGSVIMKHEGPTIFESEVVAVSDVLVRMNVAYYPGWQAVVDGRRMRVSPDDRGSISICLSRGTHSVRVFFSETPIRRTANLVSFVSLFWFIYSSILKKPYARSN